jgi:FkbM family methyltransferase
MSATFPTSPTQPLHLPVMLRVMRSWEFPRKLGLCDRLFGATLAAHGTCWVGTAAGPVWKLDLANHTHRWIVYGYYEGPGFWRWLRRQRTPVRTLVDSGANIGQTILYFATLLPEAKLVAYEPGAAARGWLSESIVANGFANISVVASGLGAQAGLTRLAPAGGADRHGSWNRVSETEGEPISLATLDDELARLGLGTLDLWKLDMEGYELFALQGAARALAEHRIHAIYVEAAGENGRQSLQFLGQHGYLAYGISDHGSLHAWQPAADYDSALVLSPNSPFAP